MTAKLVISSSAVPLTALLLLCSAPVQAQAPAKAYLWAHDPTGAPYEPAPAYSFNSSGARNMILTRASVGEYVADLPSIGAPTSFSGNYHVSAYGGSHFCNIYGFGPVTSSMRAGVKCYDAAGNRVDGRYTLLFHRQTTTRPTFGAYLHAGGNSPLGVNTPVGTGSSWNSTGAVNSVLHQGLGRYQVNLPGMPPTGSQAIVTAINSGAVRCRVLSWNPGGGGTAVQVSCQAAAGAAVDSDFFVSYITDPRLDVGPATSFGSFVWANRPGAPSSLYSASSNGRPATLVRAATGTYTVTFPGLAALNTSTAIVSAYGFSTNYCNPDVWVPVGDGTQLNVRCYNASGSLADTVFTALYTGVPKAVGPSLSIDRFDTGPTRISLTTAGDRTETIGASVLGGFRTLKQMSGPAGVGGFSQAEVNDSLDLLCGCNTTCRTEVTYGRNASGAAIPLNLNLSANRRFRIVTEGTFTNLNLAITVYFANNTRYATAGVNPGGPGEAEIDFDTFLAGGTGDALNWADIDHIALILQYQNGTNVRVRSFSAE